jgi:hypothetical protein
VRRRRWIGAAVVLVALVVAAAALEVAVRLETSIPHPSPPGVLESVSGEESIEECIRRHGDDARATKWHALERVEAAIVADGWTPYRLDPRGGDLAVYRLWPKSERLVIGRLAEGRLTEGLDTEGKGKGEVPFAVRSLRYLASLPFKLADPGVVSARIGPHAIHFAFESADGTPVGDRFAMTTDPETGLLRSLTYRPTELWSPLGVRVEYTWARSETLGLVLPETIVARTVPFGIETHSIRFSGWR